ncbi:MAG: phospholipase, partial [Lysobacteraceae bacterium]
AYWDGGITDYHLHLDYQPATPGLVLYPHFQKSVVPGWLDKGLKWRHRATPFLDSMVVIAPDPDWVRTLPNGKLPDRTDFTRYGTDLAGRVAAWSRAVAQSQRLADEWAEWLARPDLSRLEPL